VNLHQVKLFAAARQLAGRDVLEVELADEATVAELRRTVIEKIPALANLSGHLLFAVDAEYAPDEASIPPGAEVACIPPVSGG